LQTTTSITQVTSTRTKTLITYSESLLALKQRINFLTLKTSLRPDDIGARKARETQLDKYTLYIKQRGRCCFCSTRMYADADACPVKDDLATIEHVIPKSRGGKNHISNYKLSCYLCNNDRKVTGFEKYLHRIKSNGRLSAEAKKIRHLKMIAAKVQHRAEYRARFHSDTEYRSRVLEKIRSSAPHIAQRIINNYDIRSVHLHEV
jgi:5-methylcytosine-specific restriction endonuclease McrA